MHVTANMNRLTKLALINLNNRYHFHLRTTLFHSTSRLEVDPRRRTHWEPRPYSKARTQGNKQELLKNGAHGYDKFGPFQSHRSSKSRNDSKGSQFFKDEEVVTDFRSTSSGNARSSFWSSSDDESSARYNTNRSSWNRKRFEHDDKESSNSNRLETDLTKERIALGLTGSGPLSLEHVKDAYRSCALKWHPDRHDGSSKAIAEEKFKVCSAAYQCLCDKLAQN